MDNIWSQQNISRKVYVVSLEEVDGEEVRSYLKFEENLTVANRFGREILL